MQKLMSKLRSIALASLLAFSIPKPAIAQSNAYLNYNPNRTYKTEKYVNTTYCDGKDRISNPYSCKVIDQTKEIIKEENPLNFESGFYIEVPVKKFNKWDLEWLVTYNTPIEDTTSTARFSPSSQDYGIGVKLNFPWFSVSGERFCLHDLDKDERGFNRDYLNISIPFESKFVDFSLNPNIIFVESYSIIRKFIIKDIYKEEGKEDVEISKENFISQAGLPSSYFVFNPNITLNFKAPYVKPFMRFDIFINDVPESLLYADKQYELSAGLDMQVNKSIILRYEHKEQAFSDRENYRYDGFGIIVPFKISPLFGKE